MRAYSPFLYALINLNGKEFKMKTFKTLAEIDQYYIKEYKKINESIAEGKISSPTQLAIHLDALFKECQKAFDKLPEGGDYKAPKDVINNIIGKTPEQNSEVLAKIENKEIVKQAGKVNISRAGWRGLTLAKEKMILNIAKLCYRHNYGGGALPINPDEFYRVCGLKKYRNSKGVMVYSHKEQVRAYEIVRSLTDGSYLTTYSGKNPEIKKYVSYAENSPILYAVGKLHTELDEPIPSKIEKNAKLKYIVIKPCLAFASQIKNHYIYLPNDLHIELREAGFGQDKYLHRFIILLADIVANKISYREIHNTFEIGFEKLIYKLQLDAYIKQGRKKMVNDLIERTLERAKIMEYLDDYKISKGKKEMKVKLYLNMEKFKTLQIIDVECEDVKAENFIKRMLEWNAENPIKPFESTLIKLMRQAIKKSGLEKIKRIPNQVDSFWEFYCKIKEAIQPKKIEGKNYKKYRRA